MRLSPAHVLFALGLLHIPAILLNAQDESPGDIAYVSPPIPADPNLAKVSMFRLLYTGGVQAPTICLVREPQGQKPIIIANKLTAGLITGYVPMSPQQLTLHILDGNVTEDPIKPLPLEEKKLTNPIKAILRPGAYQTLIVCEKNGKFTSSLISDLRPTGSRPTMRVLNLSGIEGWTVRLLNRQNQLIKVLWTSASEVTPQGIELPAGGIYRIQVQKTDTSETRQMGLFEAKIASGTSFSIILYPGQDGAGAADLAFDATPGANYSAEAIKAIADPTAP